MGREYPRCAQAKSAAYTQVGSPKVTRSASAAIQDVPVTREVAPGVRLHVWQTKRFTTTTCRLVLHRDLGDEATATSLLARVLEAATARAPSREALAERLADLYGAGLHVGVEKRGDQQALLAQLDWPTAFLNRGGAALAAGLRLLRDVWSDPVRAGDGLDAQIVETERRNLERTLQGLPNDKGSWAARQAVARLCAGEPHGRSVLGALDALPGVTREDLAALHARLLARWPVEIFLVGDLRPAQAEALVRKHLLWRRSGTPARLPAVSAVRAARARPRYVREHDDTSQSRLVFGWRARVRPGTAAGRAAALMSGLLGPGSYGRLFRVVREEHGLCYAIGAMWNGAKGYLLVRTGVAPERAAKAGRLIRRLVDEVGRGDFPDETLQHLRADLSERVRGAGDSAAAMIGWWQARLALGLDLSPSRHLETMLRVGRADVRRFGPRLGFELRYALGPQGGRS